MQRALQAWPAMAQGDMEATMMTLHTKTSSGPGPA
jgi:hypothetical protein